jgi:lipoprotein-anchoring transpeptidase ErfK/SrfK
MTAASSTIATSATALRAMSKRARDTTWWRTASWTAAVLLAMSVGGSLWAISAVPPAAKMAVANAPAAPAETLSAPGVGADDEPAATASEPVVLPPLALLPPMRDTLILNADLRTQRLTVIEDGKPRHTWLISSGRAGFATQTGTFRPQWASRLWHSRQYDDAPMPHAVFFHRGMAFHATTAVGMLGKPASHGCIRLSAVNAALLFKLVHKHGFVHTKIIVHNGAKPAKPQLARKS